MGQSFVGALASKLTTTLGLIDIVMIVFLAGTGSALEGSRTFQCKEASSCFPRDIDILRRGVFLASDKERPEMLLNTPQCTGQPSTTQDYQVSAVRTVV